MEEGSLLKKMTASLYEAGFDDSKIHVGDGPIGIGKCIALEEPVNRQRVLVVNPRTFEPSIPGKMRNLRCSCGCNRKMKHCPNQGGSRG